MRQQREITELNIGVAYILWALGCLGCCGIHRFYLGKYISGLIYLFTFGLFGLGQFIDLFFIPSMTRERNNYLTAKSINKTPLHLTNVREEIYRIAGVSLFHMYTSEQFLKIASEEQDKKLDEETKDNLNLFVKRLTKILR